MPADVVGLCDFACVQHFEQRSGVIFDKQPIADLKAIAIDRQRLARQRIEYHKRNQFFRKLAGAVVVRTIAQHDRQAISAMPGADHMIGRGFAGGVRRAGSIGRCFGKQRIDTLQVAINLVGGNVMKAKSPSLRLV
ncbi:hypothetical protein D3C87_1396070 [compost metagenome]